MSTNEVEVRAKEMGWMPKEQYKGNPDMWLDAEAYVKKGEEFIPFLRANNRKQQDKIQSLEAKLQEQDRLLRANGAALAALQETANTQTIEAAEASRDELIDGIADARQENDVRKEEELRDKLNNTNDKIRKAKAANPGDGTTTQRAQTADGSRPTEGQDFTKTPEWQDFKAREPWLFEDTVAMATANAILMKLNADGKLTGKTPTERFDMAAAETKKYLGRADNPRREQPSKVESGRSSGEGASSSSTGSARSYDELPADAKAACAKQEKDSRLVGKGKKFENAAAYRKYYTSMYFGE